MQDIEFVNDLCCNYLTVPYEGEETDFALRMLMVNITDGFLTPELRRLDGQTYLYYNISGMQSMEIIYAEKTIGREAFRTFMQHLHEVAEQSMEMFLPEEGICLEPSALFWNLGIQKWEFAYIPKQNKRNMSEIQSEKERLAEFLVMRIDYADKELTDAAYRFYEEICAGRMYSEIFLDKGVLECQKEWENEQEPEIRGKTDIVSEEQKIEGIDIERIEIEENGQENGEKTQKTSDRKRLQKILFIVWCIAAVSAFLLGRTMKNIWIPGGAVILLTIILLYIRIRQRYIRTDPVPTSADTIDMEEEYSYIPYETGNRESEDREEEKTVYVDIRQEQERRLYGVGKFRQQKIFLDGLPCIIGKDKTLVNHIIQDTSVSRMHARFFEEEKAIWMQDLNSTNGTYHNGLRLRPNEKVVLEPEDEVGFGRVQFIFR